jgi:integrase
VYVATGMFANPEEFNAELFFTGKDKRYRRMNEMLSSELERAEQLQFNLKRKEAFCDASKFKELFLNKRPSFNQYFEKYIETKIGRTKEIYQSTLNKLNTVMGNVSFEEITFSFLQSFERKMMEDKLKTNARGIHFRNIRAVYNQAINEDIISLSLYPFRKFKIKKEATLKRSLSAENLQKLFAYSGDVLENRSRDIAKLIFFLIGINIKNLVFLKGVTDDRIEYYRVKTNAPISIKLEPEAMEIISQYRGDEYLLRFAEDYASYKTFNTKINKHLAGISEKLGISKITTYAMRHSWATLAAELEIPKETIAAALGHSQGNTVTDVYIQFNRRKIDDANRRVIDYILDQK